MSVQARKRFGQHFLTDQGVLAAITDAIDPQPGQCVVEIGPGRAALTRALLTRIDHLCAIEIDRDLSRWLSERYADSRLKVIEGDALEVDFTALARQLNGPSGADAGAAGGLRLVGNLPYNISSPLLLHLIGHRSVIIDQHFMLQKEVVERIAAHTGESDYGRLTVMMQAHFQVEKLFDVGPQAFEPPPKVESAVIRMRPWRDRPAPPLAALEQLTAAAFAQKRKMLRKTLIPWLTQRGIDASAVEPTARAEDLSVETYCGLARALAAR